MIGASLMKGNDPFAKLLVAFCAATACCCATAEELPPGVPSPIGPDGKYTHALFFTTPAYHDEALKLVLQEANEVAKALHLSEKLPITRADVVHAFIGPFGYAYVNHSLGNITTRNYFYNVRDGYKFSNLAREGVVEMCRRYQEEYLWPLVRMDTNAAYRLATQWLAAVSVDVKALSRDHRVTVICDHDYVFAPPGKFVPVYVVSWLNDPGVMRGGAYVRLFEPTETLLELSVDDPKYILRKPLVVTNLAFLLTQTNTLRQTNVLIKK